MGEVTPDELRTLASMPGMSQDKSIEAQIAALKDSLTEDMQKAFSLLENLCLNTKPGAGEEKSKDKKVDDVKDVAALKKFQYSPIAGSILLHHDFEQLFDILKGFNFNTTVSSGDSSTEEKQKKEKGKSGKKLNFAKNLGEIGNTVLGFFKSVVQIGLNAIAIVALSPAILVSIPVIGILFGALNKIFSKSKLKGKDGKNFSEAAKGIADGIKGIAVGILLMPLLAVPLLLSLPLMPALKFFIKSLAGASQVANKESGSFKKSLITFAILTGVIILMTGAVMLASKIGINMKLALKALVGVAAFLAIVIVLGALAGLAKWGIIALGVTGLLLSASFLIMSLALGILSEMDKNLKLSTLIKAAVAMLAIVVLSMAIGLVALLAIVPMTAFLLFSVFSLVAFGAFFLTVKLIQFINESFNGEIVTQVLENISTLALSFAQNIGIFIIGAASALVFAIFSVVLALGSLLFLASLGLFKLISLAYQAGYVTTAIDAIAQTVAEFKEKVPVILLGIVAALTFMVFSILLAVGSLLFLAALGAFAGIAKLSDNIEPGISAIKKVATEMANKDLLKKLGIGAIAAVALVVFGGFFLIGTLALLGALVTLEKIVEVAERLKSKMEDGDASILKDVYDLSIGALYTFTTGKTGKTSITKAELLEATKNCFKLAVLAADMLLYTVPMAGAFLALTSVFSSLEKLKESSEKIGGKEEVDKLLGSVGIIFESLATTAESFKGMSAKAITAIGSLVKDVAEAISLLADTMIKIKDGISEDEVAIATDKIKLMCLQLFGDGETDDGTFTLTKLFKVLSNGKLKKLKSDSVEALVPIIEAIDKMADVVIKMGDDEKFSEAKVELGKENFTNISSLFTEFTNLCTGLVQKTPGNTIFSKVFGDKSPLKAIKALVEQNFFDTVEQAVDGFNMAGEKLAGLKAENLEPVIDFFSGQSSFFATWISSSEKFVTGMKNIGNGFDKLNKKSVEAFDSFIDTLSKKGSDIDVAVDSLIKFANKASAFSQIADSFKSMADSLNKISKNKGGFMDIMKSANDKSTKNVQQATQSGKSDTEKMLEKLEDIQSILYSFTPDNFVLGTMNHNGIMIASGPKEVTGVSPVPVKELS